MSEKSNLISKLIANKEDRVAYIKGKLAVFIPAQIRALRLRSNMPRQADLAKEVGMQQSRISMFETPGGANFTIDTLARLASVFKVGLIVKFVPFHKMLEEENEFSQDTFNVIRLDQDIKFLSPSAPKPKGIPSALESPLYKWVLTQSRNLAPEQGKASAIIPGGGVGLRSAMERNLGKNPSNQMPYAPSAINQYQQASPIGLSQ